jgi:hypothetical protein
MKRKYALAVHHLNIAYTAGNEASYHRQLREGIVPLLDLLERHPRWCFSIEMSGYSIDFIGTSYPMVLNRLRKLVEEERIELISCTYAPQIWICFPRYDMIKSIEYNLKILKSYNLKPSRIFFSQENFSGEGMKTLTEWFDIAIVKDDYYFSLHEFPQKGMKIPPFYRLDDMKLMIGWGHILEGLGSYLEKHQKKESLFVDERHKDIIKEVVAKKKFKTSLSGHTETYRDMEWQWYHIGSSERFAKGFMQPQSLNCRFDPEWHGMVEQLLLEYENDGFIFSSIQNFIHDIEKRDFQPQASKPLLDGAWNMENSFGGFIWMGLNSSSHEDDLSVRNQNWLSRSALLGSEVLFQIYENFISSNEEKQKIQEKIELSWKYQLLAESSDSTGWFPDSMEVFFSIMQSEQVFNVCAQISNMIKDMVNSSSSRVDVQNKKVAENSFYWKDLFFLSSENSFLQKINLFGAEGSIKMYGLKTNKRAQRIIVDFKPNDIYAGIEIDLELEQIVFSPALMENTVVSYDLSCFKPDVIYLPLTNGLIGTRENLFLIKHNDTMSIACCIDKKKRKIRFGIEHPKTQRTRWVLTVFRGGIEEALGLANRINISPVVWV